MYTRNKMIQLLNHTLRDELGITPISYLVLDCYWQLRTEADVNRALVSLETGLSSGQVADALKELAAGDLYQEEQGAFGAAWLAYHSPMAAKELGGVRQIAEELTAFFKEKTGRDYRATNDFMKNLRNIIRMMPKEDAGIKQFKGVIEWAALTWKEEFKDKVRPQTLFRSPQKFAEYLELARTYWKGQIKK